MNNYRPIRDKYMHIVKIKSRIRERATLSTDADSRTDTNLKRLLDLSKFKKKCGQKKLRGVVVVPAGANKGLLKKNKNKNKISTFS